MARFRPGGVEEPAREGAVFSIAFFEIIFKYLFHGMSGLWVPSPHNSTESSLGFRSCVDFLLTVLEYFLINRVCQAGRFGYFASRPARDGMEIKFPIAPPRLERKNTRSARLIRFR